MLSPEQPHDMHLAHTSQLCSGAKSVTRSGLDVQSLTEVDLGSFTGIQTTKHLARK